jgi:hypothetical protein
MKRHPSCSAILPIQQIPHRLTPGGVGAFVGLERVRRFSCRIRVFFTARRTTIREPRLPRFQLKLLPANHTRLDRIRRHTHYILSREQTPRSRNETVPLKYRTLNRISPSPEHILFNVGRWCNGSTARGPSLRLGFRHAARTPRKRLKFESVQVHPSFTEDVSQGQWRVRRTGYSPPSSNLIPSAIVSIIVVSPWQGARHFAVANGLGLPEAVCILINYVFLRAAS